MSDLIERLRSAPNAYAGYVMHEDGVIPADGRLMHEAADEIERLTAVAQHAEICVEAYRAQVKTLTAERDELRRQPAAAAPAAPQATEDANVWKQIVPDDEPQADAQPTAIPAPFMHLLGHACGLSLGTDWNRGTHAEHYRRPLLDAVAECKRWLGSAPQPAAPQAEPKRKPLTALRILEIEADANRKWRDNGRIVEYAVVFARMIERAHGISGGSDE